MIALLSENVTPTLSSDILVGTVVAIVVVGAIAVVGALFSMGREPFRK